MMRNVDIPFESSKNQKEKMAIELKKYAQGETLKELQILIFAHAMRCDKKCGGNNNNYCEISEWLHGYVKAFKEEMIK